MNPHWFTLRPPVQQNSPQSLAPSPRVAANQPVFGEACWFHERHPLLVASKARRALRLSWKPRPNRTWPYQALFSHHSPHWLVLNTALLLCWYRLLSFRFRPLASWPPTSRALLNLISFVEFQRPLVVFLAQRLMPPLPFLVMRQDRYTGRPENQQAREIRSEACGSQHQYNILSRFA